MKQLIFLVILSFTITHASAQNEDCKVLMDSLKGAYTGDCKSGKANGTGNAKGIHTYEGEFKNGFPEGKGKYTWSNGNYYYGAWKKGIKEGKGELHYFENGKEDVIKGYWRKDKYSGEYENPYVILNSSNDIGRISVNKLSSDESTISISVSSMSSTTQSPSSSGFQTSTVMTNHQVIRGFYLTKSNSVMTNKEITIFRGVEFPFRGTFTFGNSVVELEFFEKGAWDVTVPINR